MCVMVIRGEGGGRKWMERTCALWRYGGIERVGKRGGRGHVSYVSGGGGVERLGFKKRERTCALGSKSLGGGGGRDFGV